MLDVKNKDENKKTDDLEINSTKKAEKSRSSMLCFKNKKKYDN